MTPETTGGRPAAGPASVDIADASATSTQHDDPQRTRTDRRPSGARWVGAVATIDDVYALAAVVDPVALGVALATLWEGDALLVAARAGIELGDARRAARRALREVALDVHGGDVETWRALANGVRQSRGRGWTPHPWRHGQER